MRPSMLATAMLCGATLLVTCTLPGPALAKPQTLVRSEIPDEYKWDLGDVYESWEAWESDVARMEELMQEYTTLRGTLADGPESLVRAFELGDELGMLMDRISGYADLMSVTDMRDNEVAARGQRVRILGARFSTEMAWFTPELLAIPWETMSAWLDATPALEPHRFGVENLYRQQAHVLSEDQERLLSYFNPMRGTPPRIYNQLSTSDIEFGDVTLSSGETVRVTPGEYYSILSTNRNQEDRAAAFAAHYGVYVAKMNTYAAIYDGVLQRDWANAQARNYDSCLESALDDDNIPMAVYENLVATVRAGLEPLHRYTALRKRALKLDSYHTYDGMIPLVDFDRSYPYDDIGEWIIESVAPLGEEYQALMRRAFEGGWVDVYENEGKMDGAFSAGVYGVHPYMLLNYNETLNEVFTVAHEMGHTLHTMLANENQPYSTADYTIFVAEVASTLNEALFLDYLLEKTDDPVERVALLTHAIDSMVGTYFVQTMFADFELRAHQLVEEGQPITADVLRELYTGLVVEQQGPDVAFDDQYGGTWTRISHFYHAPFYVYQYATCYASSSQIHAAITTGSKEERQAALDRYLALLKSGGSDYPMEQLKAAGVDLTDAGNFQAVIDYMGELVDQLEQELERLES